MQVFYQVRAHPLDDFNSTARQIQRVAASWDAARRSEGALRWKVVLPAEAELAERDPAREAPEGE